MTKSKNRLDHTIQTHLVLFSFTLLPFVDIAFLINERFVEIPHWTSLSVPFFQHHLLTSCLLPFGDSHNISNFFIIIMFAMILIFDVTFVTVLGQNVPLLCKTARVIHKCCLGSDGPTAQLFPSLALSLGLPIPWDTIILKVYGLITRRWARSATE